MFPWTNGRKLWRAFWPRSPYNCSALGAQKLSPLPLFLLLFLALAAVSLTPLIVSDVFLIGHNRDTIETMEKKYTARSASALAESIAGFYRSNQEELNTLASTMKYSQALTGKNPFETAAQSGILPDFVRNRSTFLAIRVIDRSGRGGEIGPKNVSAALDAEFQNGFSAAIAGQHYSGRPLSAPGLDGPVALLAEPVLSDDNEVLGVVEGLVSWLPIERQIEEEARQEITVTLLDRRGNVLLSSKNRPPGRPTGDLVSDFERAPARLTRAYTAGNEKLLGSIVPVEAQGWGVLVEKRQKIAFASVAQTTRETIFWSVVALALAIVVSVFIARALVRPIQVLATRTREIAQGHYGRTVPEKGAAEIAALSASFNRMSLSIETAMRDLQQAAQENHDLFISSVRALANAIDAKDPYTRGHSERVSLYAVAIARAMELSPEEVRRVRLSGLLHDVGKIGIDDRILRKPTALTDEEFEIMKQHPVKGAAIMTAIPQLKEVVPGMKHHHERWEGGGYPDNLQGEQIPLLARIIAVADTFDAMTTTRPYQKAMETSYVIEKIRNLGGTRFDPCVTEVLVKAYANGGLVPPVPELPAQVVA